MFMGSFLGPTRRKQKKVFVLWLFFFNNSKIVKRQKRQKKTTFIRFFGQWRKHIFFRFGKTSFSGSLFVLFALFSFAFRRFFSLMWAPQFSVNLIIRFQFFRLVLPIFLSLWCLLLTEKSLFSMFFLSIYQTTLFCFCSLWLLLLLLF